MNSLRVRRVFARPTLSLALLASVGFGIGCSPGETVGGSGGSGNPGSGGKPGSGGASNPGSGGASNPGSGGASNPGSGGASNPGSGGSGNPGTGGSGNPGSGGSGNPGTGGSGNPGTGGQSMGGSGSPGTGGSGMGGNSGGTPPGWWTYQPKNWAGCSWTGIDTVAGTTTKIMPQDFTKKPAADPYCVSGTVHASYESVALLGFNLAEPVATADCTYKATVDPNKPGPPGVTMTGTGIAVSFSKKVGSTLRVQIQGPNGAKDANDRWCYGITEAAGPVFVPFNKFNTKCWDGTGTNFDMSKPISAIVFLVPGAASATSFDYCIGGFSTGTSVADAPAYTGGGPVTGMIGGAGAGMDIDLARVKVAAGGKSYIIQNNNWGNPTGSDQTISYKDNSFKVVSSTGSVTGQGVPASFPSIYIGDNGNRGVNGAYSTRENDGLPKTISQIQSVMSTFKYNHATSGGRNYNATYDIWFSSQPPSMSSEYKDGISGFVMVWLFKPTQNQPIGSKMRTATINGATYDVWVGPRGGSMANSNAPVVSYVAQSSATSFSGDLKAFMTDAATNGIQSSWYLTDVFGGFEIWQGSDATNLEATEFTAIVK